MKKHNASVDFLKTICSWMVVMGHCNFFLQFPQDSLHLHAFYSDFFPISNGVFFMITGFFLFRNETAAQVWKRTGEKVVLPAAATLVAWHLLDPWLRHIPLAESGLLSLRENAMFVLRVIALRENAIYWFPVAYIWVIIFFPVLKGFADYLAKDEKREWIFLGVTLAALLFNDVVFNRFLEFGYNSLNVAVPSSLFVLYGHILYKHRDLLTHRLVPVVSVCVFLLFLLPRPLLVPWYTSLGQADYTNTWFVSADYVCGLCMCAFFLHCFHFENKPRLSKLFTWLGSFSFSIYMIHPFIVAYFRERGYSPKVYDLLYIPGHGILYSLVGMACTFAFFYLLSLAAAALLRTLYTAAKRAVLGR